MKKSDERAVSKAFKVLRHIIQTDHDYAYGWHCNVASQLIGEHVNAEQAELAAARFMLALFQVDMAKSPYFATLGVITGDIEKILAPDTPDETLQ